MSLLDVLKLFETDNQTALNNIDYIRGLETENKDLHEKLAKN